MSLEVDTPPAEMGSSSLRRTLAVALGCLLAVSAATGMAAQSAANWVGAWGFPAIPDLPPWPSTTSHNAPSGQFNNTTYRQIVRISCAAAQLRIRISNEFGDSVLRLGSVHAALANEDGSIVPGSDHELTFSGEREVTLAPHAPSLSDPAQWPLPALTKLAISIFVPDPTTAPAHRLNAYVAGGGDFTAFQQLPNVELRRTGGLVSEIDVASPHAKRALVTLGDSITEGFGSTPNAFRGWVDILAERLQAHRRTRDWSIVNAGINSNRLLHDNPGANALARFDRDVLSVPGVRAVLILEGINDIGYSHMHPEQAVSANQIIAAYRQLIARAHARHLTIFGGTITPFTDSHYFDAAGEQMRQQVNSWIRASAAFDAVIDFDAVMRDPQQPGRVRAELERGDHLHPNDAGYGAMARSIDLRLLARLR